MRRTSCGPKLIGGCEPLFLVAMSIQDSLSSFSSCIFFVSHRLLTSGQRYEHWSEAETMSLQDPFTTASSISWKSPPKTTVMPPNGSSVLHTSQHVLVIAKKNQTLPLIASLFRMQLRHVQRVSS